MLPGSTEPDAGRTLVDVLWQWNADRRARSAERAAASAGADGRITRLSAFCFPFFVVVVARVEQSETRELNASFTTGPGFRCRSIRATALVV
jgi:hypothetical protein